MKRAQALLDRARTRRLFRVWDRYGQARGNVLAAGIAYFGFFSLFPALAVGFTVFGLVLGRRTSLQTQVVDGVNATFGGAIVIGTRPGTGVVTIDQLVQTDVLTITGLAGLVVLLLTGLGWVGALREGVSLIFGRQEGPHPVRAKVHDLGVFAAVGLAALVSALVGILVSSVIGWGTDWLGLAPGRLTTIAISVVSSLLLFAVDVLLFLLMFRLLAGLRLPMEDLFTAALGGAVAIVLLKISGGLLLHLVSGNRFLAASSILVGLLVWMNLAARAGLLAASWAATTAADAGRLATVPGSAATDGGPVVPGPRAAAVASTTESPTFGPRAADRTTLLAGAVLGATAAVTVRTIGRAGQTLRDVVRGGSAVATRDD